jgi:hypothetical protein
VLETDLLASAGDRLTYIGGAGDDSVSDMKVHDGKVWITGSPTGRPDAKEDDPRQAISPGSTR